MTKKEYDIQYQKTHKKEHAATMKRYVARIYEKILFCYGHQCSICGDDGRLCLDHIGGYVGVGPRSGEALWRWVIKNNFPPGFRMLCHSCNVFDGQLRKYARLGLSPVAGIDSLIKLKRQ